jgi:Family of unknown function (DUF5309)
VDGYIEKAIFDTVQGANANREDLSNTMYLTDGPMRPILQNIGPSRKATNTTHQWNEIGLNTAARTNVAGGGATYAEGSIPNARAVSPARKTNKTANIGRLAQVSDNEMAAFNGGGSINLADGEMERLIQDALDFETALVTVEVLNQLEWMHVTGDTTVGTMEGGEFDGLIKWATAGGFVAATGGTTTTPVNMAEQFLKDAGRGSAENYPSLHIDTYLVPPELVPDINSYVANGAGRPIVVDASGQNFGLVGGHQVGFYNDGFSAVKIEVEPYLSPLYNANVVNPQILGYRKSQVRQADLIALGAAPLARIDTSVKRLVNCVVTQEHSVAKHTVVINNVKSAIA